MAVLRSIVFAAVLSGVLVGSFATIAQHIATVPLVGRAEVYEQQAHNEQHEDEGWQPANGFERNTYTALFDLVDWIGFALLLNGALVLMRRPVTWREGFLLGLGVIRCNQSICVARVIRAIRPLPWRRRGCLMKQGKMGGARC